MFAYWLTFIVGIVFGGFCEANDWDNCVGIVALFTVLYLITVGLMHAF